MRDSGPPVMRVLTLGCQNMILAKGSKPEMNVSEGSNCSRKDHVWGLSPISRNTRRFLEAQQSIPWGLEKG